MLMEINIVDPSYIKSSRPHSLVALANMFHPTMFDIEMLERQYSLLRNDVYVDR